MNDPYYADTSHVTADNRARVDRLLEQWKAAIAALSDNDVELMLETFAPVLSLFDALQRDGVRFDAMLTVLMRKLRDQCHENEDDDTDLRIDNDVTADFW
jgi:hypothetical protein